MRTWSDLQLHINLHKLPFSILRFNMSLQGRLIDLATGTFVAATIKEAADYLKTVN